jgi:two-component system, cell cycle sensor histidine kinase and response regulator CckA
MERQEDQIRGAQRIEAIGRLAGGVAHDFNNLLTVILNRCESMLNRLGSNDPMLPDVMLIHDAALKAAAVTQQLLAFGRKQVLQPTVVDLNTVIFSMKTMLLSLISENIHLSITLQPDVWRVEADKGQLEQVIVNLVVNAIDAMSGGGSLEIRTASVELDPNNNRLNFPIRAGRYVEFSVRDTGGGMDPETMAHVFEPFFTTKDKGTGLGLSMVYGIVKQSGGYVAVSSAAGEGSTFKVYLPAVERQAEPIPAHVPTKSGGTETILLVEDAQLVRKLTQELLEVRGYHVIEAASPEEALRVCQSHDGAIDLILSDIIMPKITGRELAEQAVRLRPGIKILLMSGYADEITRSLIVKTGFHFIAKPFTSDALAIKVREALDG